MTRTGVLLLMLLASTGPARAASGLDLEDCRISAGPGYPSLKARCGMLTRPLDPAAPDGVTIDLFVAIVPALDLEPDPDPVVPLAGGPGQSAVAFYASYAHAFEHVRRNRDILLVDQRGTGDSARLDCPVDAELVEGQYSVDETKRFIRECLDQLPHDPRFFTTSVAVADLEAVRDALGYPTINLYGVSYGTRVAQHYARRYPSKTRTLTLDGVVPPQLVLGPSIAIEAQRALDKIFARCAEDAACSERFPDLAATFDSLRGKLRARPVRVESADPLSGEYDVIRFGESELAAAIRLLTYHANTIAVIPLLVAEAAAGHYQPIVAQYRMTLEALSETISLGMHNAVMCSEDAPNFDSLDVDEAALAASYIGPTQLETLRAICSVWPAGPVDEDFREPPTHGLPTLLLSGDADPITPPAYADIAARGLRLAWLLTLEDQGHGQLGVGCMPRIFEQFVSLAGLDGVDVSCREANFLMPFFLGFAGPAP